MRSLVTSASNPEAMDLSAAYTGDELVPDANMVYNQLITVSASAEEVFPWIVQLGKGRGGWYLTTQVERIFPRAWRATRRVEPQWQSIVPGDRVEDYGFDASQDYFIVAAKSPPTELVYQSDTYGCSFTWALLLHESVDRAETVVHLRFRGKIQATGVKRWCILTGGEWMDWLSTRPMLAGLKERVERAHRD